MPEVVGLRKWGPLTEDDEGHRTYKAGFLIRGSKLDGPYTIRRTPGLPLPGSRWNFGNDNDSWAFCHFESSTDRLGSLDDSACAGTDEDVYWIHEATFSTKPVKRCQDDKVENPLLEPIRIRIGDGPYMEEAYFDRFGLPIVNSAWEQMRGTQVEFQRGITSVEVNQNLPVLNLALQEAMKNTVNDQVMWGMPPRTILLDSVTADEQFYGTCGRYYTRQLQFKVKAEGWDKELLDEGTMALNGRWNTTTRHWSLQPIDGAAPNRFNPAHFTRFTDFFGNPTRVVLNGFGVPAGVCVDNYVPESFDESVEIFICIEAHSNKNLLNSAYWRRWKAASGETAFAVPPNLWDAERTYYSGSTATANELYWVCTSKNINSFPTEDNPQWVLVNALSNQGVYNSATSYTPGQYVIEYPGAGTGTSGPCNTTAIGRIRVEKYSQSNFLLLGVPLVLPTF